MMGATTALVLLGGLLSSGSWSYHDLKIERYRVDGWRLEVRRNSFTGQAACTIRKPNVTYAHGVMTFGFGHRIDTANATFRVDGGPVRTAGSVAVEAAGLGAQFNGSDLNNPSDGEVHIPAGDLQAANTVSIQPNSRMTHRSFDLRGISSAIGEAKNRGCDAI